MSQDLGLRVDVQLTNENALPLLPPDNNEELRAMRMCFDELYTELYAEAKALVKDEGKAKEIVYNTCIAYYIEHRRTGSVRQITEYLFLKLKEYCILPYTSIKTEMQKTTLQTIKEVCCSSRTVPVLKDSQDSEEAKQIFSLVYFQNLDIEDAAKRERITVRVANNHYNKALTVVCFLLHGIANYKN